MNINKLWVLPVLSSEIEGGIKISNEGIDIILSFKYLQSDGKQKSISIKFESVLCHLHTSERFTKKMFDSYDTLVSINDSEWLNELKSHNSRDFDFWKPNHFVIYFDGVGQYQFISSNYTIIETEVN